MLGYFKPELKVFIRTCMVQYNVFKVYCEALLEMLHYGSSRQLGDLLSFLIWHWCILIFLDMA